MRPAAARFAAWPWGPQLGSAGVAGALGALAHAPYDIVPAIFVPLGAGFFLLFVSATIWRAAVLGGALGFGYFAATMTWIIEPFQVDAATTGWMAPFALVLLAILLGSFWGAALAMARWSGGRTWMLALTWSAAEMLRAYVFTGFPWASPPQVLVDVWGGQGLAWLGPHGVMLVMVALVAGIFAVPRRHANFRAPFVVLAALACIPMADGPVPVTPYTIRLVQPNAPQDEKWDPDKIPVFVNRQIDYTAAGEVPDLVIWPETALPYLAENAQNVFDVMAQAARGAPIVLGIQRREDRDYFNSLVVLDANGQVSQTYDKHHLVPFGEYMPAEWLFRHINVAGLAQRATGGYASGPGPRVLDFGPLGAALPLICYEAVFAHDVGRAPKRPDFLMQLTNDAWFGARSGPQQHLAQARMRAIEQGLPMVRAANTGISALIDQRGRVRASLALNTAGYLDVVLPAPGKATLYSYTGDWPSALIILLGLLGMVLCSARNRGLQGIDVDTRND